jgi:hypothetical protein
LVGEVEFGVGAGEEVGVRPLSDRTTSQPTRLPKNVSQVSGCPGPSPACGGGGISEAAHEGGANQAAMAGDVDFGVGVHAGSMARNQATACRLACFSIWLLYRSMMGKQRS